VKTDWTGNVYFFSAASVWNISHSKNNSARYKTFTYVFVLFLSDFKETWIFSTYLRKILKYQISWKYVLWEPSFFPCERTDAHTWRSDEQQSLFAVLRKRLQTRHDSHNNRWACMSITLKLSRLEPSARTNKYKRQSCPAQVHSFLTSELDRGYRSASRSGRFTPGNKDPGLHRIGGWVSLRSGLDVFKKTSWPLLGIEPRYLGFQPVTYSL